MTPDEFRKTRLHDEKGNRVPLREISTLPRNAYYTLRRRATGGLPPLPWLAFNAIRRLEQLLQPEWHMVEFGSGMSTSWYAGRVAELHSIEHDADWHTRVRRSVPGRIRYELRQPPSYWDMSDYDDGELDFAVVDGIFRAECVQAVVPKIRAGGWLLLDNTDTHLATSDGDMRRAESTLRSAVAARGGSHEEHTGFAVGYLLAVQWQLARL